MSVTGHTTSESFPPSYFANLGQPLCSIWGKTEIERLALAYVQALAKDGDKWKRLSRKQVYKLLSDEQKRFIHTMLTFNNDHYIHWFELVSDQITDSDGAFGVKGFWRKPYNRSDEQSHERATP